jgi:hypothetical protein
MGEGLQETGVCRETASNQPELNQIYILAWGNPFGCAIPQKKGGSIKLPP